MKLGKILVFVFSAGLAPLAFADSVEGVWTTTDDNTGQKRAVIRIEKEGDGIVGKIVKVFPQPGDTNVCAKCPGEFKDKPIPGITVIWGLRDKGNGVWDGGNILDPKNGKIYKAKISLQDNKLYVRGYIGIAALGRTQVWER